MSFKLAGERLKVLGLFSLVNCFTKLCYVLEKVRVFNFVEMNQVDKIGQISFVL